jgi:hypothetical protein
MKTTFFSSFFDLSAFIERWPLMSSIWVTIQKNLVRCYEDDIFALLLWSPSIIWHDFLTVAVGTANLTICNYTAEHNYESSDFTQIRRELSPTRNENLLQGQHSLPRISENICSNQKFHRISRTCLKSQVTAKRSSTSSDFTLLGQLINIADLHRPSSCGSRSGSDFSFLYGSGYDFQLRSSSWIWI